MRNLIILLSLTLSCCGMPVFAGCAALPVIASVLPIVVRALDVLDDIDRVVDQAPPFDCGALAPAKCAPFTDMLQAKVAIALARKAAEEAKGETDPDSPKVAEVREAYGRAAKYAAPFGVRIVRNGGPLGAQPGGLGVPAPEDL